MSRIPGVSWSILPVANLAEHAQAWDGLNAVTTKLPIMDAEFLLALLEHFGTGGERLVLGHLHGQAAAAAIVAKHPAGRWATFQPSQAPLGAWLARPEIAGPALWRSLLRSLPGPALLLGISQQDPCLAERPPDGDSIRTVDYIETAAITNPGTFAEYWARRGQNLRHNLQKQRNRLEREQVRVRLQVIEGPEAVAAAVDDYGRLESQGWKAGEGTTLHPDNAQGRFYRLALSRLAGRGEATVYQYWFNDTLAATDLCVHRDGVLIILKTTHCEEFSKVSATHLMRQEYFEQLFSSGAVRRIEFYGKLMDWHTKWSDEIRRMYHVNVWRWPALASLKARWDARRA